MVDIQTHINIINKKFIPTHFSPRFYSLNYVGLMSSAADWLNSKFSIIQNCRLARRHSQIVVNCTDGFHLACQVRGPVGFPLAVDRPC